MSKKLIEDVGIVIQSYKNDVSKGYELWKNEKLETVEELLRFLKKLFQKEEIEIKKQREKPFVTDIYENGVRSFAIVLMQRLLKDYETIKEVDIYREVTTQKHMAYAFYHLADKGVSETIDILQDIEYTKRLYEGLVNFYSTFYGSFADNEEAIRLLCRYYPIEEQESLPFENRIIETLYEHISNAGTSSDFGYAYRGIEQIRQYIDRLPSRLIRNLLKQYRLYDVVNQKVNRHQIFAIIHWSEMEEEEKHLLKFFYLDSILLANIFNHVWFKVKEQSGEKIKMYINSPIEKLNKENLLVFEEPNAHWSNESGNKRLFMEDGQEVVSIALQEEKIVITFKKKNKEEFPFDYNEWILESYRAKETREGLYKLILGVDEENEQLNYKQMMFSLLYLDQYRGLKAQTLDFDHRFTYEKNSNELVAKKDKNENILHFYGKAVYSLSCIVGKNGTGKTSVVDFLRETFYKLLKIMEDFNITCEQGCVCEEDYIDYGILDKGTKFLVVFRLGAEDYYLTNIEGVKVSDVKPYQKGIYQNMDEFCKVAYFSSQLSTDLKELYSEGGRGIGEREKERVSKALNGLRQCDYSETKSLVSSINKLMTVRERSLMEKEEPEINKELCYQFALMRNLQAKDLCEYLDIADKKEFTLYSLTSGENLEKFSLSDNDFDIKIREFEKKYIRMPDVRMGFLSSGQNAKFMFLSKMYWFIEGYHKDCEYYREVLEGDFFSREDVLQEGETALIFIDEGELYYHPEWQRRYLSTLLGMLRRNEMGARLQIVFTTNSPFVISDVLKADVQYLSDTPEDMGNTLGQNIHRLLKNNFFMDYTIGEYSRELIEKIIKWMDKKKTRLDFSCYFDNIVDENRAIDLLISQIGEPVYRNKLERMFKERMVLQAPSEEERIRELENQKAMLEKEIACIKAGGKV